MAFSAPVAAQQSDAQVESDWHNVCQDGAQKKASTTKDKEWFLTPGENPWNPGFENCAQTESQWRAIQKKRGL